MNMLDGELQRSVRSREELFAAITKDPWDHGVASEILMRIHGDEQKILIQRKDQPEEALLPVQVSADAYNVMTAQMTAAKTLEEKYRLLAKEVPLIPKYSSWYRVYPRQYWYDVVQGFPYTVQPHKRSRDPMDDYPDNVYDMLGKVLKRTEFLGRSVGIDLGSGPGESARALSAACGRVVAYDLFPFMHDIAAERDRVQGITNIMYSTADITRSIPAADNSAQIIVSNGLSAFVPADGMDWYISEIKRVLVPGGSYLEPGVEGDAVQAIMEAYQTNGKTLLSYMLGEMMTSPGPGQSGAYPHSSEKIGKMFAGRGFRFDEYGQNSGGYHTGISVQRFIAPE